MQKNIALKPYNSFGIDEMAMHFAQFETFAELEALLEQAALNTSLAPLILGGGSNILLTKPIERWVLKNELKGIKLIKQDAEFYYVQAASGENWHQFVLYCVQNGYAGLENLSLIPGTVGAAPIQNIGAYGVEIKDVFDSLEAYHILDKKIKTFNLTDCAFDYRESIFKNRYKDQFIILSVRFKLRKQPIYRTNYGAIEQELAIMGVKEISIQAISNAVIRIRSSKLPNPTEIGNAGSFFKNPTISANQFNALKITHPHIIGYPNSHHQVKIAAGWLIEQTGWKGFRVGDAGCHAQQALVLVNYGNASGKDILNLSTKIIESVYLQFGITLEREVNLL